jgi:DNA-binding phage protein
MSKAKILDATKYRNNPKLIAKYLNDALATDDPTLTTPAIGHSHAPTECGRLRKRRT